MERFVKWTTIIMLVVAVTAWGDLVHRYKFDSNCDDSEGGADATLVEQGGDFAEYGTDSTYGSYLWLKNGWDQKGNLSAGGAYVELPDGILNGVRNDAGVTIEMFVQTTDEHWWAGYFTFGCGDNNDGVSDALAFTNYENDSAILLWHQEAGYWGHRICTPHKLSTFAHIALVVDNANNTMNIYINGELAGSEIKPPWELPGVKTADNNYNDIANYLGRYYTNDAMLHGKIFEFRIWNEALSAATVLDNYDSFPGLPGVVDTYNLTLTSFSATPGTSTGKDSCTLRGTFTTGLSLGDTIELAIGPWEATIDTTSSSMRRIGQGNNYMYSGAMGSGTGSMMLNLDRGTISLMVRNIDLGGLTSPVEVDVSSDEFVLEATVNTAQNIKFLKGYTDTIRVSSGSVSSAGRLNVRGSLAAEHYSETIDEVTVLINDQAVAVFPAAGESLRKTGYMHMYIRNRTVNPTGKIDMAIINLDTGMLMIMGSGLTRPTGAASFGLEFRNAAEELFFDAVDTDGISP